MVVRVERVSRTYPSGRGGVVALQEVSFSVDAGDFVSIMGPSGSGKSTLLNILGCLDRPTHGSYFIEDRNVSSFNARALADIRGGVIGFVFQTFNLIPSLSAAANVEVPLLYRGLWGKDRRRRSLAALESVGIAHRAHHRPTEMSGGEQQRVAIARALVTEPTLILADEATGNLDSKSSLVIMGLLQRINEETGVTIIQVTHDAMMARFGKRMLVMRDGQIMSDHPVQERLRADALEDGVIPDASAL